MACSLIKKGVMGAALGAGALYLAFGTSAPSYVKTAFHKVRHNVKGAVPVQFEIDRARGLITGLEPAIRDNIEHLARQEEEVKSLDSEITAYRANMVRDQKEMVVLRDELEKGGVRLTGNVSYTADEIEADVARRLDSYKRCEGIVKDMEETLKSKQKSVVAARQKLNDMGNRKRALEVKIEEIQAKLKAIEATKSYQDFNFDDSQLAQANKAISDLDKELNILSRRDELMGRYSDPGVPVIVEPKRDVLKEFDTKFGSPIKKTSSEKSL